MQDFLILRKDDAYMFDLLISVNEEVNTVFYGEVSTGFSGDVSTGFYREVNTGFYGEVNTVFSEKAITCFCPTIRPSMQSRTLSQVSTLSLSSLYTKLLKVIENWRMSRKRDPERLPGRVTFRVTHRDTSANASNCCHHFLT